MTMAGGNKVQHVTYFKMYSVVFYQKEASSLGRSRGIMVSKHHSAESYTKSSNTFQCSSGYAMSTSFVCDGIPHCGILDKSDESECFCNEGAKHKGRCKFFLDSSKPKCSQLYYLSHGGFCQSYVEDSIFQTKNSKKTLENLNKIVCGNQTLDKTKMNDLVSDCVASAEDENVLKDVLVNHTIYSCPQPQQVPCRSGHNACFNITDICIFRLNSHKNLIPCRTGEHMEDCADFECNMMYKCPGYYCVSFAYLFDGKWDCPDGSDEAEQHRCDQKGDCRNKFHCASSQMFIHIGDVCENSFHCPLHDDEFFCSLKYISCPKSCLCHIHALLCSNRSPTFDSIFPYIFVAVTFAKLERIDFMGKFPDGLFIHLRSNTIENICGKFYSNKKMLVIDVGFNKISTLAQLCFQPAILLREINLENNRINNIDMTAFEKLHFLKQVNLSSNNLQSISSSVFKSLNIYYLSIKQNPFLDLDHDTFVFSEIIFVDSNDYRICCITHSASKCLAKRPWYLSCSDL